MRLIIENTTKELFRISVFTRAIGPALGSHPPTNLEGLCAGIIVTMNENEIPIVAGPRTGYVDVLVTSLDEESIAARLVSIESVDPADRSIWACTPGDEVYVVERHTRWNRALSPERPEKGLIDAANEQVVLASKQRDLTRE